jgi:hypothetical protein
MGSDVAAVSACPWSLTVDVGRTNQSESTMTLTALAQGGSGNYVYNWATYSFAELAAGLREYGGGRTAVVESLEGRATSSAIEVDNGHYVVMLNVKDRATGAFRHHQQQVFSSAFPSDLPGV